MLDEVVTPLGTFREVARSPHSLEDRWIFQCPGCGLWAYMDDDQWHGRVSVDHSNVEAFGHGCTYHETHDYYETLKALIGRDP